MGWLKGAYLRVERVLYDGLRARADARLAARARKHGQRPQPTHLITGERGEDAAFFYLRELGYTVVARRWRSDRLTSDLDLVAWDGPTLVFFEVKTRTARDLFPAEAAVNPAKQRQLRKLTSAWLAQLPARHRGHVPVRFDVLSVYLVTDTPEFEHMPGAFPYRESS